MNWLRRLLGGSLPPPPPLREPVAPIATVEPPPAEPRPLYGDQRLRKSFMEDRLAAEGVRVNPHLPVIESEAETSLRSAQEVAGRLLALVIVAAKGEGLEPEHVGAFMAKRGILPLLTPKERAFIEDPAPSRHECVQFSWRYEAAWVLFWALGWVERGTLGLPRATCDVAGMVATVRDTDDLAARGLRRTNDVLNEADLIYRCDWAVVQASIDGEEPSGGLHPGVTRERHRALNWLIRYEDADWDEVPTDT